MTYIIENANILKEARIVRTSLKIEHNRIVSFGGSYSHIKHMKMNADSYIMTPTHIILDTIFSQLQTAASIKEHMKTNLIAKGCTTFMTYASIQFEHEFNVKIKELMNKLMNSPIDYIIAVKIPLKLLQPSFLRKCKKEKIPAIFVEITDLEKLYTIPWGWIREALFPYQCPLIPVFKNDLPKSRELWAKCLTMAKVPYISFELEHGKPLSLSVLKKIGIFPIKSNLHFGGEVSYNLYLKNQEFNLVDENQLFHYYGHMLECTVHKGTVIRAGKEIVYRPGFGEHVKIDRPGFYQSYC